MGSVIQILDYQYLQKGAGDDWGNPLAAAVHEDIPVSKILSISTDTTVAGCNSKVVVQTSGSMPTIYYGAATVSTILSTINTTS